MTGLDDKSRTTWLSLKLTPSAPSRLCERAARKERSGLREISVNNQQGKVKMGLFERYLSLWVTLCIAAGVILGNLVPGVFSQIAALEYAHVNLVVAVLIWLMIYPIMVQVDFTAIKDVGKKPKGLVLTLVVNWLIKPFTMALLGWLFFKGLFADFVDPQSASEYIAGMILLGVAPCTAMVFIWSQLTKGDANYTLVQVSVNDVIMIFAFAPISAFLLGISDIQVPWETLLLSVVLYVVLPLVAGAITRKRLDRGNDHSRIEAFVNRLKPWSIIGLLATVVLLFGFQAGTIINKPMIILLIAIPLLIQTYGIFAIAYFAAKKMKLPHNVAAPACMIGTSNFFELAVAVAISLFGLHSGAALATVVGVLVEVPVMLSLVWFANRTRHWFD
jgi:arsenite transporter